MRKLPVWDLSIEPGDTVMYGNAGNLYRVTSVKPSYYENIWESAVKDGLAKIGDARPSKIEVIKICSSSGRPRHSTYTYTLTLSAENCVKVTEADYYEYIANKVARFQRSIQKSLPLFAPIFEKERRLKKLLPMS